MFSPWYAWSGRGDPRNHCCLNVVTYGPGGRFCMTDRGRSALTTTPGRLQIGPSAMDWDGTRLTVTVDERGAPPLFGRLKGQITLEPEAVTEVDLALTADRAHVWRPFAPRARVRLDLGPGWDWTGHGYMDANFGTRPLESDFSFWTWGRYPRPSGGAWCFYDGVRRDGSHLTTAIRFDAQGRAEVAPAPPNRRFARSLWQVRRETRADPGTAPRQVLAMLDAPFYSRSAVRTRIDGEDLTGVPEALALTRWASPGLKPMIALRVPRRP